MDSKIFLENGRIQSKGYAMLSKDAKFTPFEFTRHAVGDNDILIKSYMQVFVIAIFTLQEASGERLLILVCLGMR